MTIVQKQNRQNCAFLMETSRHETVSFDKDLCLLCQVDISDENTIASHCSLNIPLNKLIKKKKVDENNAL